jgi:hypothetical protein
MTCGRERGGRGGQRLVTADRGWQWRPAELLFLGYLGSGLEEASMTDSLEGCPWAGGGPAEEAGCGRQGQTVMAPPTERWRASGGRGRRRGQVNVVVRKGGVEGEWWLVGGGAAARSPPGVGVVVEVGGGGVRQRRDLLGGEGEGGEGVVGGRGREWQGLWQHQSTTMGSERVNEEVLRSVPTRHTRGRRLRCGGTHVWCLQFFSGGVRPAEGHVGVSMECYPESPLDVAASFLV